MLAELFRPEVSRHKCLIYSGHPSEQLPVILPCITNGLKNNLRCIYLGSPEMISMVEGALQAQGINVAKDVQRGALIFSSDRGHLKDGGFNPQSMIETLCQLIDGAVQDGFEGLCATGDMMWELGSEKNLDRLLEYEALLEKVFRDKPLTGICQYHTETIPERAVRDALTTHQSIYLGDVLNRDNLFYVPPELLLDAPDPSLRDRQGEWMWQQINRISRAESERDQALARLAQNNQELEQRVSQRTAELEMSNKELEAFCYTVSHDLRTPLRAIDGFSQAILQRDAQKLDAEAKADFSRVRAATQRMSQLIDGLLSLARIARSTLENETVDLSRQAELIIQDLRRVDPARQVEVAIEPGLIAQGDPRLLTSALGNLLENAWKFTSKKADAKISVGAIPKDGQTAYVVRDNGAGFDMAYHDKLFAPFQRYHPSREFPGTGIGLATVQRIVQRHQGRLWVETQPNQGAAFYFTLSEPQDPPRLRLSA